MTKPYIHRKLHPTSSLLPLWTSYWLLRQSGLHPGHADSHNQLDRFLVGPGWYGRSSRTGNHHAFDHNVSVGLGEYVSSSSELCQGYRLVSDCLLCVRVSCFVRVHHRVRFPSTKAITGRERSGQEFRPRGGKDRGKEINGNWNYEPKACLPPWLSDRLLDGPVLYQLVRASHLTSQKA